MESRTIAAEDAREKFHGGILEVAYGAKVVFRQDLVGFSADTPDSADWHRRKKSRDFFGSFGDDGHAIRLVEIAGQLGQEHIWCNSNGCSKL